MPHETAFGATSAPTGLQLGTILYEEFPSDFRWVRRIIQQSVAALEASDMATEHIGSVEIVLAEALNNIVDHAYPQNAPGDITLSIRQRPAGLLIEIRDKGTPMPGGRAPLGQHPLPDDDGKPTPEGGYGWFLIRELVRDLIYDRRDGENLLIFRMAFP